MLVDQRYFASLINIRPRHVLAGLINMRHAFIRLYVGPIRASNSQAQHNQMAAFAHERLALFMRNYLSA